MVQDQSHTDELIAAFANLDGDEERRRFILDHPVMIGNSTLRTMAQRPSIAIHYLRVIDVVGGRIATTGEDITMSFNADRYPVGKGSGEKLWNQIEAKQIAPAVAIDQAKQPTFSERSNLANIKALGDHCRHLMEINPISPSIDSALWSNRLKLLLQTSLPCRTAKYGKCGARPAILGSKSLETTS